MEIFNLRLVFPKNRIGEFERALVALREPIEAQFGCNRCGIYREIGDESAFALVQEWRDREALDRHFRSMVFAVVLSLIDASVVPPTIQIVSADNTEGLDAIARVRSRRRLG